MSTTAHGDPAVPAEIPTGAVAFEVTIAPTGLEARLVVRPDPPGSAAPPAGPAAIERAEAALLRSGVVHGVDADALARAVAAADGAARVVARATRPVPPVDGSLDLIFAADAGRDPFFTVAAGTLLARRIPPRPGVDGTAVTGAPLPAPRPRDPALAAGAGARASRGGADVVEVHAAIEGRPRLRGAAVTVEDTVRVAAVGVGTGEVRVRGSLAVAGVVAEGSRVTASGRIVVAGIVDHARLEAAHGVAVGGSCMGSRIRAGILQGLYARLLAALGTSDRDLASLCAMTAQVVDRASAGGRSVPPGRAMDALLGTRFPALAGDLAAAAEIARGGAGEPAQSPSAAIAEAARGVEAVLAGEEVSLRGMARLAEALAAAMREMGEAAGAPADVTASYLQACRVSASGSLTVTGAGTYNTDVDVGGDLRAEGPGATVRGGELRAGGLVRVRELGAPGGARVRVVLEGPGGGRDRLRAGVAHPGVEVVCAGQRVVVDARTLNLAVGCDEDNGVVRSGALAD